MKKIIVSYIIPAYNTESTIENCITQIQKQKFNKEIIVVDDGSKDKTKKIAEKLGAKVITIPNSGASIARNLGIELSTGDYIALIDSDSYLNRNWTEKMVKNYSRNIDFIITFPDLDKKNYELIVKRFESDPKVTLDNIVAFGNGVFFSKNKKEIVKYNENFLVGGEDWEIIINLLKKKSRIIANTKAKFKHKHQFSSQKKRILTFIKKKFLFSYGDMYCFLKHRDVKSINGFFRQNLWITPFFPLIYSYIKLKKIINQEKIENIKKEFIKKGDLHEKRIFV